MKIFKSILLLLCCCSSFLVNAQYTAATPLNQDSVKITKPKHNPKIATRRSAILPGWGQAYNKEYWKIPIVYGVLAIPTTTFIYNNTWYNRTKTAYELLFKASDPNATQQDIDNLKLIHPKLQGFSLSSLQKFRNTFRQDRDYSVLWFVVAWGLNVVDATVFAHLKEFDVSNNLSMQIKPSINPVLNTKGVSLVFNFKKNTSKPLVKVR